MKKVLIMLLVVIMLMFAGCSNKGVQPTNLSNIYIVNPTGDGFYYVIDKNTDVVYLVSSHGYHHSMSVMLNNDGSPITAGQLGIVIDEDEESNIKE